MKTITLINWAIIGIYAFVLLWALTASGNSQQDAAGRGMAAGLLFLAVLFLVLLVVLNLLPYQFARITGLVIGGGPLVMYVLSLVVGPLVSKGREKAYENEISARTYGFYYFHDPVRKQLAAAIATGNVTDLETALKQPIPNLNESGEEHTTLLDFATNQARQDQSSQAMQCLKLLMEKGATVENTDTLHSPTHFLVTAGNPTLLEWFLKKGANPNAKDATGKQILFDVLYSGNDGHKTAKIALLLAYGADPNATPPYDELVIDTSPLIHAADNELWDICQMLLDKGADPTHKTRGDLTIQQVIDYKENHIRIMAKYPQPD